MRVFYRGVAGQVLRAYMAGGKRWLLVETQGGLRLSWLASDARELPAPRTFAAQTMATDRNGHPLKVGDNVKLDDGQVRVVRAIYDDGIAVENNGNGWMHVVEPNSVSYHPVAGAYAQTMATGADFQKGDWVTVNGRGRLPGLTGSSGRVVRVSRSNVGAQREIVEVRLTPSNALIGEYPDGLTKSQAPSATRHSTQTMAATAEDRDGRAVHVGDSVQVPGAPVHPLHKVVAIDEGGHLTLRPAAGGALVEMPASEVVARLFDARGSAVTMAKDDRGKEIHEGDRVRFLRPGAGGASGTVAGITSDGYVVIDTDDGATISIKASNVVVYSASSAPAITTMASVAAKDAHGASLAVGDHVRSPYGEVGTVKRISSEDGRVVVWADMGQTNEVSRGLVGWNASGLVKVLSRATTMANEAAKSISLPSGWRWLNGAESMTFPVEYLRYTVTRYMADQSPSTESEGAFASITSAIQHANSLLPDSADAVTVYDHKRGFAVATCRI